MATCGHGSVNVGWRQSCQICSESWIGRRSGSAARKSSVRGTDARNWMRLNRHGAEKKRCYLMADSEARGVIGQTRANTYSA